jgi:integrase
MIYTGFRVGEMLKLTVNDVDFKNAVITGGLKTDAGKNRTVPIHNKILPFLMEWRKNKAGNTKLIDITYGKYRQIFIEIMDKLQIENKTPHSCRHTFATRMAQAGADVNALKSIIGHSSYSTTADVYTHMNISDLKKAISGLN